MFEVNLLLKRAKKIWDNQTVFCSILTNETLFPLYLDLPVVSSRKLTDNFVQIRSEIQLFTDSCKLHNIQILFKDINHRQVGLQRLPKQVCFTTLDDYLCFIGKEREYKLFRQTYEYIISHQPKLHIWLIKYSDKILEYQKKWPGLLQVCGYFLAHPKPNKYIRELEISGVDSKFMEQHKSVLMLLLNELLPAESIIATSPINKRYEFEIRYGLKYIEPVIRFRILDQDLFYNKLELQENDAPVVLNHFSTVTNVHNWHNIITDYTIPLGEFIKLNIPCSKIFITENKINGLSFPSVSRAIIILGLGYGIEALKNIPWFANKNIMYWGDIDTHGFAMLSQLRSYYPHVRSILMDLPTLNSCRDMWVSEPMHTRCTGQLPGLTIEEQELYQKLLNNQLGENVRLEQERISYHHLTKILNNLAIA